MTPCFRAKIIKNEMELSEKEMSDELTTHPSPLSSYNLVVYTVKRETDHEKLNSPHASKLT